MITGKKGGFSLRFVRVMGPSISANAMIHRAVAVRWIGAPCVRHHRSMALDRVRHVPLVGAPSSAQG